jgi:4,5-DOPA dioxygenase extradiol
MQIAGQTEVSRASFDEGVVIIGSGNLIHNLNTYAWGRHEVEPFDWAVRFENQAREFRSEGNDAPLIDFESGGYARGALPNGRATARLLYVMRCSPHPRPIITYRCSTSLLCVEKARL